MQRSETKNATDATFPSSHSAIRHENGQRSGASYERHRRLWSMVGDHEAQQDANCLIREAADGARVLTSSELQQVLQHVAAAGFDPLAREAARGPLRGLIWNGLPLAASTRIPADARHWLLHVRVNRDWPDGTTLLGYVQSLRTLILDPESGVFTNSYKGELSLGVIRSSRELRGPGGSAWVLVQYRVATGHWTTGFQPVDGLDEITKADWGRVQWLRRPTIRNAST